MKKILLFTLVVLASMAVKAQNEAKEVVVNYFTGSGLIMTSTPIDCSKPRSRADVVYDMSTFVVKAEPKHGLYAGDAVYGLRFCGYNTGKALKRHVKVWATATMNNLLDRNMDTTGGMTCIYDGLLVIPSSTTINTNQQLSDNICIPNNVQVTIQSNVVQNSNCRIIVESGGILLIDGGVLNADVVLKSGATLRIINDGTVETHNAFEAQLGSIVDIVYGKII